MSTLARVLGAIVGRILVGFVVIAFLLLVIWFFTSHTSL